MLRSDLKLVVIFVIIAFTIIIRVLVERTGYCSYDSLYYLQAAQNLLDGKSFYLPESIPLYKTSILENQLSPAYWPVGYPLFIAGFAFLFSMPVFWASKAVNIFFLGLCFLLFRKMSKENAYLLSLMMCSFTFLEIFSYTWSEGPFLFGLLWFAYALYHYLDDHYKTTFLLQIFCSSLFLFLIRYVGGFSFIIIGGFSGILLLKKSYAPALKLLYIFLVLSVLAGLYLFNNYLQTGFLFGGEHLNLNRDNLGLFIRVLFSGLFNELFFIRNYYWQGEPIALFLASALFQFFIMAFIYYRYIKGKKLTFTTNDRLSSLLVWIGFIYLLVIMIIRYSSPVYPIDYRLLSPFTLCVYTAIILYLIQKERTAILRGAYKYILILFSVSLLLNLPKTYFLTYFQNIVRQILY